MAKIINLADRLSALEARYGPHGTAYRSKTERDAFVQSYLEDPANEARALAGMQHDMRHCAVVRAAFRADR